MSNRWTEIQNRSMSRQNFLKLIGMGLLVLINLDVLFKLFHHGGNAGKTEATGYGSGGYSGFVGKSESRKGAGAFD